MKDENDPLHPLAHDPNPLPPTASAAFTLEVLEKDLGTVTVDQLKALPESSVPNCYIVSTGHGTSGPFTFIGVTLFDFLKGRISSGTSWAQIEVISADGFGTRIAVHELSQSGSARPILLSYAIDGRPMTRQEGLVRLIVPGEADDALRQVKWIGRIRVL